MHDERREPDETPMERSSRQLIELLNELRIVLPGITVLLGFLLAVPFARGWTRVTGFQRDVFIVAFLATAVSVAFLIAPSSYHRIRFRQGDRERMLTISNRLSIAGITAAAVSLVAVVLLVTDFVASRTFAIAATAALFVVVAVLWYGLPLRAAVRDRSAR
jgi:amino acid transporter